MLSIYIIIIYKRCRLNTKVHLSMMMMIN